MPCEHRKTLNGHASSGLAEGAGLPPLSPAAPAEPIVLPPPPEEPTKKAGSFRTDYESLKQLLELAPLGYQSLDENGLFIHVNQTWLEILGYSRDEVIGRDFTEFLHPDWRIPFRNNFPKYKSKGEVKSAEFEMLRKDGATVSVSFDGKIARDAQGNFQQTHCFFREITDQKKLASYREMGREILQILSGLETLPESIHRILNVLRQGTGFDAVGIRLQDGDDFPFYAHKGFSDDFLAKENFLLEPDEHNRQEPPCRGKDGATLLACACGLVLAGRTDPAHPLCTLGGSFWVNDSRILLDLPFLQDAGFPPRNQCVHGGYASFALVPIRVRKKIVGLLHFGNARKGSFSPNSVGQLEAIASHIGEALLRKQAESQLEEERSRLTDIIEFLPDATFAIDHQGQVIIWNKAIEKMTGLSAADMVGRGNYAYTIPFYGKARPQLIDMILENHENIDALYPNIVREGQTLTTEVFCNALHEEDGGAWVFVKASPLHDQSGRIVGAIASIRDITDRKFTEEKLKKSVAWFKALFNATSDSVILVNADGTILDLNENAARRRSLDADALRGKNLFEHLPPAAAAMRRQTIDRVLHERRLVEYEEYREGKHYLVRQYPIMDNLGRVIQVAGFSRDISESKKAEEEKDKLQAQLIQSQKMEAIGTLAGGIAHDFNNILGAILGYTEMAQDHVAPGSPAFKHLERIQEAGERAGALVKQILAFSRQADAKRIPVLPSQVVREAVKLLRPSLPATISIELELEDAVRPIFANPTQVHQILINLCTNAFHAMEHTGGILKLVLKNRKLSGSDLQHRPEIAPGRFVELAVGDSGSGISPEIREKIFDPYFTTKEVGKGTGMGLAIVHGIVTSHNGLIACDSEVGKGTVFRIHFPVAEHITYNASTIEAAPVGTERILFVDDEEMLVELGVLMLERLGYEVTGRTNSLEALLAFQNQPDAFDAVITDHTMPGLTGSDLALRILQIRPEVPIILCTGYSNLISEEKARLLGIRGFAMKPLAQKDIALLLRNLLDQAAGVR
ncbi:MAG: PAS domain S-box protein [Desulfobulbus sp.]|jgi:PAS domain S-box-containing protein|uniref:PAS domain S-box protein n=1 Tax=Desulfobulbus sp. TaxID=895 RepID=UPI0028501B4D|nr:PAS domain S-box protein [Desulfobulbus sp.]MDR2549819.1 PAS domain S-box protein [Desulfobulbus sp.]